jgi:hypothetical protein
MLIKRKVKPELPYMSKAESLILKKEIEQGRMTIFRLGTCHNCENDIIKNKNFCSEKCYEEYYKLSSIMRLRKIIKRSNKK